MTRKKTDAQGTGGVETATFEAALKRLETIVGEMESGELSLEDMMARFEEGQSLVKVCARKLNQVEQRIEILVKEGEAVVAKPFGEEPGEKEEDEAGDAPGKAGAPF